MQYIQFLLEHWVLSSLFILVVVALIFIEMRGGLADAKNRVSSTDAIVLINKQDAKVIDIREKGAFNEGHIVNAMHTTADEINDGADKLKKFKEIPLIIVCATGMSASTIGAKLRNQGFKQVFFLKGGMNAWKADGLPVVKG